MESRTRLALGGMATVAASVAVVCAVAMTTSAALADSAGAAAGAPVLVPASTASAAASVDVDPAPEASPSPTPSLSAPPAQPETVPAPDPEDVGASAPAQVDPAAAAPAVEERIVAQADASGSWDDAYAWARAHGWPPARIDAWVTRLEGQLGDKRAHDATSSRQQKSFDADSRIDPAQTGKMSGLDLSGLTSGSKREQSQVPPG